MHTIPIERYIAVQRLDIKIYDMLMTLLSFKPTLELQLMFDLDVTGQAYVHIRTRSYDIIILRDVYIFDYEPTTYIRYDVDKLKSKDTIDMFKQLIRSL